MTKHSTYKHIYFIGIGGIGMSALARYFNNLGVRISGYDKTSTQLTKSLESQGMSIHYSPNTHQDFESYDLVVYTPAIPKTFPEFEIIRNTDVPLKKRSEVLGDISLAYITCAVAGTHGKTTTSTILGDLMVRLGLDPLVVIGGIHNDWKGNFYPGEGKYLVTEADEFDRSFLTIHPRWSIINSLDPDHLDIYKSTEGMIDTYLDYLNGHPEEAVIFIYEEAWLLIKERVLYKNKYRVFGFSTECDYRITKLVPHKDGFEMTWTAFEKQYKCYNPLPGKHNALNTIASLALISEAFGLEEEAMKLLPDFQGITRRFQKVYDKDGVVIIDDYAHHPTEIKAAIETVNTLYPNMEVHIVFQAHLYSRTKDFFEDFIEALSGDHHFYSCELYPAREEAIPGISGYALFDKVEAKSKTFEKRTLLPKMIKVGHNDVVLILGAGNINLIIEDLIRSIE